MTTTPTNTTLHTSKVRSNNSLLKNRSNKYSFENSIEALLKNKNNS